MNRIEHQYLSDHSSAVYGNKQLFMVSELRVIRDHIDDIFLVEGVILVLVKQGHVQLEIDGEQCDFYAGELFGCRPNVVVEKTLMSVDIEVKVLFISPDYAFDLVHKSNIDWSFSIMVQKHKSVHLSPEQLEHMEHFLSLLEYDIRQPESPNKSKRIDAMMLTLVYMLCDLVFIQKPSEHEQPIGPKDNLMERFFLLLKKANQAGTTGHHYLTVSQYADKLNVTAKYFSTVCKNSLGKTAGEIIDDEIISSAKVLLYDNNYSIKQISDMLGFSNQSHFGTFFKRHTGVSPKQFRNE